MSARIYVLPTVFKSESAVASFSRVLASHRLDVCVFDHPTRAGHVAQHELVRIVGDNPRVFECMDGGRFSPRVA